jgi:hypothetical protein
MSRENEDQVCGTCRFYHEEYNECRRHAVTDTGFPNTELTAWCGEYEPSKVPLKEEHPGWRSPLNKCEEPI